MQHHVVTNRHIITNDQGVGVMRHMQHAEILDIGPIPHPNIMYITSDHSIEPDTALFPQNDVTNHNRRRFDKTGLRNRGFDALKRANHDGHSRGIARPSARGSLTAFFTLP